MSAALSFSEIRLPPVQGEESSFVIGQDSKGRWVAVEVHGRGGGLFRDRAAAFHYAEAETGRRPNAVRISGGLIELRT